MNKHQKNATDYENKLKAMVYPLTVQLATTAGFLNYYYKILPKCKSQKTAFEIVNLLHFLLFNQDKYSSFDSFKQVKNKEFKN